jgi:hypothetical protein
MNMEFSWSEDLPSPIADESAVPSLHEFASNVDRHVAALWLGDEQFDDDFARWLASCLESGKALEPRDGRPVKSVLAAGGSGIRWYETPAEYVGFIPGVIDAHYVVRKSDMPLRLFT